MNNIAYGILEIKAKLDEQSFHLNIIYNELIEQKKLINNLQKQIFEADAEMENENRNSNSEFDDRKSFIDDGNNSDNQNIQNIPENSVFAENNKSIKQNFNSNSKSKISIKPKEP